MGENVKSAIDAVLGGRIEAYAEVIRAYQEDIWRVVAYALRDVSTTEDLVQQVFLNAYIGLERYNPDRDLGAWLRSIARNLVRNEIRRGARERGALRTYRESLAERLDDDDAAGRDEARRRELKGALEECREGLSPDAGHALDLRYARSLDFGQIAETLGRTVAATRQLLSRVRLALRRCIEERTARS